MHGTHGFKMCISPVRHPTQTGLDRLFVVSRSHTIRHTRTPGWTPLDEWSSRRRGRYPHKTQRTQKTNFHALSAFRTRDPTSLAAADLRLRPHGYRHQKHLESFEMWCWRRMEKISWTDHVRNEDVLLRVKEQRNILHEIRKRKANWIGHILRRNCILQRVIEGKIKGGMEVTERRGRRRRKLLDDRKERRGYSHLKVEALDRTIWRAGFRRDFGPVVRQTTKWMNVYFVWPLEYLIKKRPVRTRLATVLIKVRSYNALLRMLLICNSICLKSVLRYALIVDSCHPDTLHLHEQGCRYAPHNDVSVNDGPHTTVVP